MPRTAISFGVATSTLLVTLAVAIACPPAQAATSTRLASGTADADITQVAASGNGRYVAFVSAAGNLGGPGGGVAEVYVEDLTTGTLALVSRAGGAAGAAANQAGASPSLSADGRYVAFESSATNLVPGVTAGHHVYIRDTTTGSTTVADLPAGSSTPAGGYHPALAAGGRYVAFVADADPYFGTTTGFNQVIVRDLVAGTDEMVSQSGSGAAADDGAGYTSSGEPAIAISSDGRYVAFASDSTNLDPAAADGAHEQVFLRDRTARTTRLVSGAAGADGNADSYHPSVADDGAVAFYSGATNLDAGAGGVFVRPPGGAVKLASRDPGPAGAPRDGQDPALSADGSELAYTLGATTQAAGNLPPGATTSGTVVRRNVATGDQDVVAVTTAGAPFDAEAAITPGISSDGGVVAFASQYGQGVDASAPNGVVEAFARAEQPDRPAATAAPAIGGTAAAGSPLTCLSGDWSGSPTSFSFRWLRDGSAIATGAVYVPVAADQGHSIACEVTATNGVAGVARSAAVTPGPAATPPSGAFELVGHFGSQGTGPGQFSPQLDGIAVAPDGDLVVTDRGTGNGDAKAQLYTPGGGLVRDLAAPSALAFPDTVAAAALDRLVVLGGGEVLTYSQDAYMLGRSKCDQVSFNPSPVKVAVDREGRIYLSGTTYSGSTAVPTIAICDAAGNLIKSFPSGGSRAGTSAIAIGPDDDLYAATDAGVRVFDATGALIRTLPISAGTASAMAVGPDGRVWVADRGQVTGYGPDGAKIASFGSYGSALGQFGSTIPALAVEADGTIDVVDAQNERIERFRELAGTAGGPGGAGGGNGGSGGSDGGSGNVVGIDVTPPRLTLLAGPSAAELRAGALPLTLRCDEHCTVSVTGELAIVKRVRTRARRHAISPRAAAAGSPIVRGKPLPRLPTYRTPAHAVITRVIWSGDFGPAGTTLTADAAGVVRPSFTFGDRTDIRRAARAGTGALITLELTATDDAGNKTTQTTEVRVTLR